MPKQHNQPTTNPTSENITIPLTVHPFIFPSITPVIPISPVLNIHSTVITFIRNVLNKIKKGAKP